MTMQQRRARSGGRFALWLAEAGTERAWVNALAAFVAGGIFAVLLRNLAVAGLSEPHYVPIAALAAIAAALAFGSLGRILTRNRWGWLVALTVLPWAVVVVIATFIVFSRQGNLEPLNPSVPVAGGLVGVIGALLAHRGVPRFVGIGAIVVAIIAVIVVLVAGP
jgi:hypothetical protein